MQLDINNPMHLRLRRLLADMVAHHANRLQTQGLDEAQIFTKMTLGMHLFCVEIMQDQRAVEACFEVIDHMLRLNRAHLTLVTARAAA
ncbi:hypothetical protein [Shewanella algae]|uniref:hypothetical protein n=1 Tax=Shewanella algae TaxID=38313 RepID=UPI001F196B12|nr:hypothetical protein [Shewanella algae]MCE9785574.1 hypothetical protein [Shewanella algae]